MKTLLSSLLIALSVSLQAAAIDWTYWGANEPLTGAGLTEGCTVYLLAASTGSSYDAVLNTIKNNELSSPGAAAIKVGSATTIVDPFDDTGYAVMLNADGDYIVSTGITAGTYDFYMAVFNTTAAPKEGDQFIMTEAITKPTYDDRDAQANHTTLTWEDMPTNEWTEIVPEPTALALLALGVAGLALRRKNA